MDREWINGGAKRGEESRWSLSSPPVRVPRQRVLMDKPPLSTLARNNRIVFPTIRADARALAAREDGLRLAAEYIEGRREATPFATVTHNARREEFRRRTRINCHCSRARHTSQDKESARAK